MSLVVSCWKWGGLFSATYVNRMQSMLERHLHRPFELVCITDDPRGIASTVRIERIAQWQDTRRCLRRIKQFDRAFAARLGTRILAVDLDMVIVSDITPLVDRSEPIVCWRVGYANVYSGSLLLYSFGALHNFYSAFAADPQGYPALTGERNASDQACLNYYLRTNGIRPGEWTERDGLITYFGSGYEARAHHGVGPANPDLPEGARIVVLGSADKAAMDTGAHDWIAECWQ